jgi:glycosyltransferase involved in cell wall biosynthesis
MPNTQQQSEDVTSPSITYVISQYPAISHTFILGEVNGITDEGIQVHVASINAPDRPVESLTPTEQAAYHSTQFVKSTLRRQFFSQCYRAIRSFPLGILSSFFSAFAAGIRYPRTLPHQIAYWLEAIVVANMATLHNSTQLHAHFSTQGCTVAMLAAEMTGIDFSLTVHGPDEFYQVNEQHLEKKFAKANFIVCISDFAKSQVMKYTQFSDWKKLHVNNLGVDASLFHPAEKNNACASLLCVGRLCNAKGQGVLIQAAHLLRERGIDFTLRFVGDGPDRKSLEAFTHDNQLSNHIQFLGKINHDQVQVLQREADIFVIPSFAEGIPIVLMEAMASGTPCVTTHITGIPELFTNKHDGLLVRPGNPVMLADALESLINDETLRLSIANNALETVKEKWCIHKSNQRLAQLFTRLLSQ